MKNRRNPQKLNAMTKKEDFQKLTLSMAQKEQLKQITHVMAQGLVKFAKQMASRYFMIGGRNAAHRLSWFGHMAICMENEQGKPVVWITTGVESTKHSQWTISELVYEMNGKAWINSSAPMAMNDFGTLFEVTQ